MNDKEYLKLLKGSTKPKAYQLKFLREADVKVKSKNSGMMDVPEGKNAQDISDDHFNKI